MIYVYIACQISVVWWYACSNPVCVFVPKSGVRLKCGHLGLLWTTPSSMSSLTKPASLRFNGLGLVMKVNDTTLKKAIERAHVNFAVFFLSSVISTFRILNYLWIYMYLYCIYSACVFGTVCIRIVLCNLCIVLSFVYIKMIYERSRNRLFLAVDWCPGLVTLRRELSRRLCLQGSTRSHRLQEKCDWLLLKFRPRDLQTERVMVFQPSLGSAWLWLHVRFLQATPEPPLRPTCSVLAREFLRACVHAKLGTGSF